MAIKPLGLATFEATQKRLKWFFGTSNMLFKHTKRASSGDKNGSTEVRDFTGGGS